MGVPSRRPRLAIVAAALLIAAQCLTTFPALAATTPTVTLTSNLNRSAPLVQVVDSIATTTTLSIDPNPVYPDESLTFTVHVDPAPDVAIYALILDYPCGCSGWYVSIDPATGTGQMTLIPFEVALIGVGEHPLFAQFPGSAHLDPSDSEPVNLDVVMDPTSTTVSALPATVAPGDPVSIDVEIVAPLSAGDQVWVDVNGPNSYLGSFVTVDAGGHGVLSWDTAAAADGTYVVVATLGGTAHTLASSDQTTFVVQTPDYVPPTGTIAVAGAPFTSTPQVLVSVPAADEISGVAKVALSNDGANWIVRDYAATQPWTLSAIDGERTVWAKWEDRAGNWSAAATNTIILDRTPPTGSIQIARGAEMTTTTAVSVFTQVSDALSGVNQMAISNDSTTWTTLAPYQLVPWTLPASNGTRTVWEKWKDGAGNWSVPVSDTIVLDTVGPTGSISIAAGTGTTATRTVRVDVTATDATSGVSEVALSNDGAAWTTRSYAASQIWVLVSGDGLKTVFAKWRDLAGNWSSPVSDTILLDTTVPVTIVPDTVAPTATASTKSFVLGSSLTSGKPTLRFAWSGSDVGSGIGHYEFALSTDGGAYVAVASSLASPTFDRPLAPGHTYRAAVQATDVAGNVGAWAYGSAFKLTAYQESSSAVHWSGTWHTGSSTSFWGGHDRYASAAGAKASLTFTGRSFAWVGSVGPSRGWAKVYVNGVLVKSVNLNAAANANRRILFTTTWSTARSRTITIRISGTAGHPRGDVDALIVGS